MKLLKTALFGESGNDPVLPDDTYGTDEPGFQEGLGGKERVIGKKGKKIQHQAHSGSRENITVIITICADGTALAPAVIFKGEGFQSRWDQENPLGAS